MLWIKAFHIIAMIMWFCGLFYLPRIFVYHASSRDRQMNERFMIMEKRLYYFLMSPGAILTIVLGLILISYNPAFYLHAPWMQIKLGLVVLLAVYHLYLGSLLQGFAKNRNPHGHVFYRWINEIPTLFLVAIVLLVVVQPLI